MLKTQAYNKVLSKSFRPSSNFFLSDQILRHFLKTQLSTGAYLYMEDKWLETGRAAANEMNEFSLLADKFPPQLEKRNWLGEEQDKIRFHPAYDELVRIAVESEMFRVKWEPSLREKFAKELQVLGFGSGYLYAMSESGQYCPHCMTDGVARLIDKFCTEEDKNRLLPRIYTDQYQELYSGAMFLTEKAGGSDVGANLVKADHIEDDWYHLKGEKWFCSNANAEIIFALARTNPEITGTKGLSIFLVEPQKPNGNPNPLNMIRLKDKLGVRSMASAECLLEQTLGKRVGEEYMGFKIMAEMINLSRLHNSIAAVSGGRRALIEAYQFLAHRESFGKNALEHALIREKLTELGSINVINFYFVWRAIQALDRADNGDEREKNLLRLLTPMVKKWTAENSVYVVRESMELMGGIGYIEDWVMPKIMRDVMVLPIWEGAGNIMILDMLRAAYKSNGIQMMMEEIRTQLKYAEDYRTEMMLRMEKLMQQLGEMKGLSQDELECSAKHLFGELISLYQMAILIQMRSEESDAWILPALDYLSHDPKGFPRKPLPLKEVEALLAWDF